MSRYKFPLVPGPTIVPKEILQHYATHYDSPDLEDEFVELYAKTQHNISQILGSERSTVVIQSGEAMVSLWGGLKSILAKGDCVLSIATGIFGFGIGDMAKQCGTTVEYLKYEFNESYNLEEFKKVISKYQPKLVTVVHCETPSGVLNPIHDLGKICRENGAFLYVDFVSSGCAVEIKFDEWQIDIGLMGTQKVLNLPPDLGVTVVSERCWSIIEEINYSGYDALLPFKDAVEKKYFPYTHNWAAVSALHHATQLILDFGLQRFYLIHREMAEYCQGRIVKMGLEIYPVERGLASPTVTAVKVPSSWRWTELDAALKKNGVCFGGSYGKLAGNVFRVGHMGFSQCKKELIDGALDILESIMKK